MSSEESTGAGAAAAAGPVRRRRLDHVDAMRPVKQALVLSTHSMLAFAPNGLALGASLMLLHVAREGFLFVSACMLTYGYYRLAWADLGRFWRRRLLAVGLPYLAWTLIYFFINLPSLHASAGGAAERFAILALTGYSQLYFLVVLLEFYVVFPLVLMLLRRTEGHHWEVLGVSLVVQILYVSLMHWGLLPGFLRGSAATREVFSYQLYLLAGCVAAVHYEAVHAFLTSHVRAIVVSCIATAALAQAWYWLGAKQVVSGLGLPSSAFQPIVIPFNLAAIALIYVLGVRLVRAETSEVVRRATHVGSDNSYSIYLSQVAFLDLLTALGWRHLDAGAPWPLVVLGSVVIVFVAGCLLGGLVGRTPLAWPLVGRHQVSWSSLRPWFLERDHAERGGDPFAEDALEEDDPAPGRSDGHLLADAAAVTTAGRGQ